MHNRYHPECQTENLFGLNIWRNGYGAALRALEDVIQEGKRSSLIVVTPNVDHLVKLDNLPAVRELYGRADYIFPDGFPIVFFSRILGAPLAERVTGADLFPDLCRYLAVNKKRAFIFGGVPKKEGETTEKLRDAFPGLDVQIFAPDFGPALSDDDSRRAVALIKEWQPHVVFVCLGMPKQELWALNRKRELDADLVLCVGAALDFALGRHRRAPLWVRRMNLEWLWRLISDPGRLWKRYLVEDIAFTRLLWKEWRTRRLAGTHRNRKAP